MRVADLFCGCGGMSAGFQSAGYEVVFSGDNWRQARLVYDQNFDHPSRSIDFANVVCAASLVSKADPEIVIGGPPCQDFSSAGLRTEGDQANLTWVFAEIVRACRPNWIVMENVPRADNSRAWALARVRLSGAGYGLTECVLDASLFGVPQVRKRLFMIGRLGERDQFLDKLLLAGGSMKPLTIRSYLGEEFGIQHYYRHPRHWGRRGIYSIDEPAATIRSTNRPISPKYVSHPLDSATLEGIRPLTAAQRSRLQTFPRGFIFHRGLSETDLNAMIANAVPVRLAEHVARVISEYERSRDAEA